MARAGSTMRLEGVELVGLGQAGTLGRYPVHFHRMGDAPASYVRSASVHDSNQRCVTVHGTNQVLVDRVVAFNAPGHCFFLEERSRPATASPPTSDWGPARPTSRTGSCLRRSPRPPTGSRTRPTCLRTTTPPVRPARASGTTSPRSRRAPARRRMSGRSASRWASSTATLRTRPRPSASPPGSASRGRLPPETEARFTNFTAWKNEGFGAWLEHEVRLEGAILADNGRGVLARNAVVRDAVIVGRTTNTADEPQNAFGIGVYLDRGDIADVRSGELQVARGAQRGRGGLLRPDHARPHRPRRPAASSTQSDCTGTRAARASRPCHRPRSTMSTARSQGGPACWSRRARPSTSPVAPRWTWAWWCVAAKTDRPSRSRCATSPERRTSSRPTWCARPTGSAGRWAVARTTCAPRYRLGPDYAIELGRATPSATQVSASGDDDGIVEVTLPWSGGKPYVYRNWDHDTALASAPEGAPLSDELRWRRTGDAVRLRLTPGRGERLDGARRLRRGRLRRPLTRGRDWCSVTGEPRRSRRDSNPRGRCHPTAIPRPRHRPD